MGRQENEGIRIILTQLVAFVSAYILHHANMVMSDQIRSYQHHYINPVKTGWSTQIAL